MTLSMSEVDKVEHFVAQPDWDFAVRILVFTADISVSRVVAFVFRLVLPSPRVVLTRPSIRSKAELNRKKHIHLLSIFVIKFWIILKNEHSSYK